MSEGPASAPVAGPGSWMALLEDGPEALYESAPCGLLSMLPDGTVVAINGTLLEWLGHARDDVVGQMRFHDVLTPAGRVFHETHHAPLLLMAGAAREIAFDIVGARGHRRPVLINSELRTDGAGEPLVIRAALFEATDRRAYERELQRMRDRERAAREVAERLREELAERNIELERIALTDPLTGVQNRRALREHLGRAVSRARRHGSPLAVALIDADNFKAINDGHGHDGGDAVLCAIAGRIRHALRTEDFMGRWGGEEFMVVAPDTGADGMGALAERVRDVIAAEAVAHGPARIRATVSVGWAVWAGEDADALVARADRALYAAKAAGRDAVHGAG